MPRTAPHMPEQLACSAFEVFSQRGFKDVSVEEIAAHAGVTKGSFYSHYRSKHDVILAACNYYYRTYQRRVLAEIAPLADPLRRLKRALEYSVQTCVSDQRNRVFTTELFALSLQDSSVRNGWAQFYTTVREMYVGLVEAAQAAGQLETEDARRSVDLMLAAMEGIKMRAVFEPRICTPREQREIVHGLFRILRAEATVAT